MSKLLLLVGVVVKARERFSPCPNSCSGHGLCDAWHVCHCADTYQGADCSQRTCPYGPAWADHPEQITGDGVGHQPAECSRRGNCDRLGGTCVCGVGFEGAACERRVCGPLLCTGRGVCRSLKDRALRRDLGDSRSSLSHFHSADPPFSAPVQTYNAWDATMMHGCDCDKGFWGPNCEFVECPRGDDPYTSGSRVVQQMLVCMGDGGSVALSFRGATTRPLAWDSSSATVRAALLELPTLRGGAGDEAFGDQREMLPRPLNAQLTGRALSVLYDNGATTLCAASGVTAIIQFNQDFGDIPLLVPDATDLTHSSIIISPSLAVALKQTSDKEDAVCSNRGLCDPLSGRCACDGEFWGSSDGYGMRGSRGDCGVAVNLASITGCPVGSRRPVPSMAYEPRTHHPTGTPLPRPSRETRHRRVTRSLRRAPATKLKFKKRAGPGDGEAGTFKIDIMAAVFGSCKCGKLKADHIGPELKCPPCD